MFVLHVQMEYSQRDTALALGMPEATVRSHLLRGRLQLAQWLRDEGALSEGERREMKALLAREQGMGTVPRLRQAPSGHRANEDQREAEHRRSRGDVDDA